MAYRKVDDTSLASVADAIREKGGTSDTLEFPDGFVTAISAIQAGGGASPSAKWNDVTFIDYDGSVLYSYSLEEAQALTELPTFPTHAGLVCQGWNWTLDAIKVLNRPVTVGAMYITDDGKTRLHIRIAAEGRMNVPLYFSQTVANGVTIEWGDGSATQTLAGTGNVNTTHTYASIGDYVITLDPVDGCTLGFGDGSDSYCVMGSTVNNGIVYCNMLQDVQVGTGVTSIGDSAFSGCCSLASVTIPDSVTSIGASTFFGCSSLASVTIPDSVTSIGASTFFGCSSLASVTIPDSVTIIGDSAFFDCCSLASVTIPVSVTSIGDSAFSGCCSLASVTIPGSVTSIGGYAFSGCYSLASVTIPGSVTSIGDSAFLDCCSLASVTIPDSVTSIGDSAFLDCCSLASVTIPDSVTSIGDSAFSDCYGVAEYHLKPTTPPTLSGTNAFGNISSDCIIYVPQGCLEAYQSDTNWATYADYMQEEPT